MWSFSIKDYQYLTIILSCLTVSNPWDSRQMSVDCWYVLAAVASSACNGQKFVFLLFKYGADLRMDGFSCKQSLHTSSSGANGFNVLTTSHLMLKSIFFLISKPDRKQKTISRRDSICISHLSYQKSRKLQQNLAITFGNETTTKTSTQSVNETTRQFRF